MPSRPLSTPRRVLASTALTAGVMAGIVVSTGLTAATPSSLPAAATAASAFSSVAVPPVGAPALAVGAQAITVSSADAQRALDEAEAALTAASSLEAEVASSGLDLGDAAPIVDTSELRAAVWRLSKAGFVPVLLFPELAEDAAQQTRAVTARTVDLRTALDAARAQKAAEEAAAQAQREAEAAAAAEAQRRAELLAAANTPDGAKAVAAQMAAERYGWGGDQFSCLVSLWQKESSWNYQAYNASSGATGIPQALPGSKMASAGSDWATNAATQIAWGLDYISRAYGTPCGAWGKSQSSGWY